jgi:protein YIPF5/7
MAQYGYPQQQGYGGQNLQFYQSSYSGQPVSGHSTPFQAYNGGADSSAYGHSGFGPGFAAQGGVSGRMGEQGGLRTGWLAAFGTEGYEGEPPLLEELGVNFGHIQTKVGVESGSERWPWRRPSRTTPQLPKRLLTPSLSRL